MDQYELIRTADRVYKKSIRQIARETGHTRRDLVAWIIPKDALSSCFSTQGIT